MTAVRLCAAADVPEGTARGFPEHGVFVVRLGGVARAWRDACPHLGGTPLAWRRDAYLDAGRTRIVCAAHGAQFEPTTGLCVLGACLGQSLTPVPLALTGDGSLQIDSPASHAMPGGGIAPGDDDDAPERGRPMQNVPLPI